MQGSNTIAALSTAPAPAGVAVIRISGDMVVQILAKIFVSKVNPISTPRSLVYGKLVNPTEETKIDSCLATFMPGPASFTGEDVCELQLHGSPLLVKLALRAIYEQGARPAQPGEFTKRAFLNSKLDLVQAEAVGDIISASSEQALKVAQGQLSGKFSNLLNDLGEPLRDCLAELEAGIDFPEEDIAPDSLNKIAESLEGIKNKIIKLISSFEYGHILREGFRVLIFGKPNVGKSSLLNFFLDSERAIVTDISGTTRDLIEEQALIQGVPFVFCDTAGITETSDAVEQIGIERARERLNWSDLTLFLIDPTSNLEEQLKEIEKVAAKSPNIWLVVNKIDLKPSDFKLDTITFKPQKILYTSILQGSGLEKLQSELLQYVQNLTADSADASNIVTNERHRNCLQVALKSISRTSEAISSGMPPEVIAAELRSVLSALDELIGKTDTEDILGRIFSKFCIGK